MLRFLLLLTLGLTLSAHDTARAGNLSQATEEGRSPLSIVSRINAEQARYTAFFERGVADAGRDGPVARELLISINDESLAYPYRYVRAAVVRNAADGSQEVIQLRGDVDPSPGRSYDLGGAVVELHPFSWDEVQIAFNAAPRDLAAIAAFITQWLDVGDTRRVRDDAPAGAIHSATPIETNGTLWFFTLDLGTAAPDVLLDLLDLLLNQGMTEVYVLTPPAA